MAAGGGWSGAGLALERFSQGHGPGWGGGERAGVGAAMQANCEYWLDS